VIERVAAIHSMEAVRWLAPYLDDPKLCQAACQAIVELAYDRGLRNPNQDTFRPLLEKVQKLSSDPATRSRAKQYHAGL
jgi:hypothetical protein